ncbi:MAG: alpha/beta hydrolase, partial [Synergistaceae bacterium]|nr:alpha/beta hydrolase [Synergistaceae bacterium]
TCPVLVLGSNDDRVLGGEASVQIMESLKVKSGCELFMYDGYGHAAYDIAPDYRERMLKFLVP